MTAGVPYDAEVEYLESTGNQFIDSGVFASDITSFDVSFTPLEAAGPSYQAYFSTSSNTDFVLGRTAADIENCYLRYDANKTLYGTGVISSTAVNRCYIDNSRNFIVNETTVGSVTATYLGTIQETMRFGGIRSGAGRNGKIKLYGCRIWADKLVRDFIPVRVGTVGCMYDRVTRKLFGNAGSGAFVLGPDVARPVMGIHRMASASVGGAAFGKIGATPTMKRWTARDYVQSGLVAMWDGIENAGWGVHDPDATTWRDLIGTNDLSIGSDKTKAYYGENYMHRAASLGSLVTGKVFTFPCTIRMTVDVDADIAVSSNPRFWSFSVNSSGTRREIDAYSSNAADAPRLFPPIRYGYFNRSSASGLWALTVVMPDDKSVIVYDGASGKSFSTTLTAYTPPFLLNVGTYYGTNGALDGKIYNIQVYSRALTAAEIARNCNIDKLRFNLP